MPGWLGVVAQLAAPLAAITAAVVALLGVRHTVRQKDLNDRRDQWWKRVQWAADLVRSGDDAARQIGLAALIAMIEEAATLSTGDAQLLRGVIRLGLGGEDEDEGAE